MTDRPIIFSGPMVRALLDGRKTQTRRVLKPQPEPGSYRLAVYDPRDMAAFGHDAFATKQVLRVPYARGDRLWVREAWGNRYAGEIAYRADGEPAAPIRWRSPIHMPRWASRLTLTVTDVRVQRLQEISEADARAEGVTPSNEPDDRRWEHYSPHGVAFRTLWDSLHGPDAWAANPWVCTLTFTVQRGNIDA